jgi:hypothetical protein
MSSDVRLDLNELFEALSQKFWELNGETGKDWWFNHLSRLLEQRMGLEELGLWRGVETRLLYGTQGSSEVSKGRLHALAPGLVFLEGPWIYQGLFWRGHNLEEAFGNAASDNILFSLRPFNNGQRKLDVMLRIYDPADPSAPDWVEPEGVWMVYYDHPDQLEHCDDCRLSISAARWAELGPWLDRWLPPEIFAALG